MPKIPFGRRRAEALGREVNKLFGITTITDFPRTVYYDGMYFKCSNCGSSENSWSGEPKRRMIGAFRKDSGTTNAKI